MNKWLFALIAILVVHFTVVALAHGGYVSVDQYGHVKMG